MRDTLTEIPSPASERFHVSTDIVIFTIREDSLQVLLRRLESEALNGTFWALPGKYVAGSQPLDDCAQHALAEQTGIRDVYLEQLYTFGRSDRHPAPPVVSVAYYALVSGDRLADFEGGYGEWWDTSRLPGMYLNHELIVHTARSRLAAKLEYSTIAFQLLPEHFTLSELQQVYETIYGRPVDKRNFRKRVLALEHVEATERKRRNGSHRPARLYRYTARDAIHYVK